MSLRSPFTTQIERGSYSAIVFKDGDLVVAEDDVGTVLEEGSNAATVINAAVDSLPSAGGLVFLKDKFSTDATITIDTAGVILMGDSWYNSGLITTADIPLITITSAAGKPIIEKLWLEGANDVAKTNNHGVYFAGPSETYEVQLRDLYIEKTYDGINGTKMNYVSIDNLRCVNSKHDGIHITGVVTSYVSLWATNVMLKAYAHTGFYHEYLMGSKIVNLWLEGDSAGYRGMEGYYGWMNWFMNVDCENHTDIGVVISTDGFGSAIVGGWFAGNEHGLMCTASKQVSISNAYFASNENMGLYITDSDRMIISNSIAINNSVSGAGSYDGFVLNNSTNCILNGLIAYDSQGTKKQRYGIQALGTSDYNIYTNNNLRGNLTGAIALVGANNVNANNIT